MLNKQKDKEHGTISCNEHENFTDRHCFILGYFLLYFKYVKQIRFFFNEERWKKKALQKFSAISLKKESIWIKFSKEEIIQSASLPMISKWSFFPLKKINSRFILGHLVSLKSLFLKQMSVGHNVPHCVSSSEHYRLETIHPAFNSFDFELNVYNIATW